MWANLVDVGMQFGTSGQIQQRWEHFLSMFGQIRVNVIFLQLRGHVSKCGTVTKWGRTHVDKCGHI
jgi:hypothetical protein